DILTQSAPITGETFIAEVCRLDGKKRPSDSILSPNSFAAVLNMPFTESAKASRYVTIVCRATLCALAYLGVMVVPVSAQYHFDSWSTQNGLPYNRINGILQTRDGYLW